jgi:molybdate transport system ATP-binding protein
MDTAPIWDVALRRRLDHAGRRFELDVAFASAAPRLALFGPSGAGKSQTLQLIAGIARAQAGHVRIAGTTHYDHRAGIDLGARERKLAHVAQDYALFPHLTVRQNIAFARGHRLGAWLNPARRAAGHDDPAVQRWIDAFELGALADHQPHQLSGGQRQRTALARALVAEPRALLLDEPFAALDAGLRQHLREELAALLATLKLPLLLITHDEADVRALADAVVRLHEGRVLP